MPSWLTELLEPERLMTVALVVFLLYLLIRSAFKLYPFVLKFVNLVHSLVGDAETPGIDKRMTAQTEKLNLIMHEVLPNHGSSLNDSVRRTEQKLEDHLAVAAQQEEDQRATVEKLDAHIAETAEYIPLIRDLHDHYVEKKEAE